MKILILGSLTIDYIDHTKKPGGPALYCSIASRFLDIEYYCYGVMPREYEWDKPRGEFIIADGPVFAHEYIGDRRISKLLAKPTKIVDIAIPSDITACIISPVFNEFDLCVVDKILRKIPCVVDIQGFIRSTDENYRVFLREPEDRLIKILDKARLVHVSAEELGVMKEIPNTLVIITYGSEGSRILYWGNDIFVPTYPAMGDPTGAGDFFTTITFVKYQECQDIVESVIYASAVTSLFVEGRIARDVAALYKPKSLMNEIRRRMNVIKQKMERIRGQK